MSSDNEEDCVAISSSDPEYGDVAAQMNSVFDDKEDFLSAEIEAIIDHRYMAGILEFHLEHTNGDTS